MVARCRRISSLQRLFEDKWLIIILLGLSVSGYAQQLSDAQPYGKFLSDTTKIGVPVQYVLTLQYPATKQVIFPDSNFAFTPFEWVRKQYFPTHTNDKGISTDSVIYTLVTFQTDSIQHLTVPVYIIQGGDCTAVFPQTDSVFLRRLVSQQPASIQLHTNTALVSVPQQANYPLLLSIFIILALVILIVYFFFGKRIAKRFKLFRMSRHHRGFMGNYEKLVRRIRQQVDVTTVENAIVLWKEYMEWLEEKPFSTYTTKEIIEILPDQGLAEALQETDRVIYAQMPSENSFHSVRTLEQIAVQRYHEKRAILENRKAREVV